MRTVVIYGLLFIGVLFAGGVTAARAQTMLNLSANGGTQVYPDEIIALLSVQVSSANAGVAQAKVNRAMKRALEAAKAVPGVTATTGSYSVYQSTDDSTKNTIYQATQTLQVTTAASGGVTPDAFTALVGDLQQNGLLLNSLDGDLSSKGQMAAQQAAIDDAIRQIQAQAAAVAATLGERVGKIQTINVNINSSTPVPRAAPMIMAAASAPPQTAPSQVTVEASVSAAIELTPQP
jgi:uncharacterized protein YggE